MAITGHPAPKSHSSKNLPLLHIQQQLLLRLLAHLTSTKKNLENLSSEVWNYSQKCLQHCVLNIVKQWNDKRSWLRNVRVPNFFGVAKKTLTLDFEAKTVRLPTSPSSTFFRILQQQQQSSSMSSSEKVNFCKVCHVQSKMH